MTVTPSDFLAFSASNINPTKANLESNFDQNPAFAKNNAFKVAYEQFQNQLKTLKNIEFLPNLPELTQILSEKQL